MMILGRGAGLGVVREFFRFRDLGWEGLEMEMAMRRVDGASGLRRRKEERWTTGKGRYRIDVSQWEVLGESEVNVW